MPLPVHDHFNAQTNGHKGGTARAARMTPQARSSAARAAAIARWSKRPPTPAVTPNDAIAALRAALQDNPAADWWGKQLDRLAELLADGS